MGFDVGNYRGVWWAVIDRAIRDAHRKSGPRNGVKKDTFARSVRRGRERAAAIRWFTECGKDFQEVCHLAGIDPKFLSSAFKAGRVNFDEYKRDS